MSGLAPGSYIVQASFPGFAPFASPAIQLAAGQAKRADISMAIEVAEQSVIVTDESPAVNIDAAGNASAIVLKGKDLEALSDDPDELSNELTALAGPSAGPNGGQIYIDGFTGGNLPSSTPWAMGASKSSPSPAPTSCTDASSARATTTPSTPATRSPK